MGLDLCKQEGGSAQRGTVLSPTLTLIHADKLPWGSAAKGLAAERGSSLNSCWWPTARTQSLRLRALGHGPCARAVVGQRLSVRSEIQ
jgi:hypothetical protein